MSWKGLIMFVVVILVLVGMYQPFVDKLDETRLRENNCLEEESYYYRVQSFFIFTSWVETVEHNADGVDYRCIKWEEEPSLSKVFLGQKNIHSKGFVKEVADAP